MTVRAVHHLNCATMCPVAGRWLFGEDVGVTDRAHWIAHVLLVETERDGLVLVDTGFGTLDCRGETRITGMFKLLGAPSLSLAETAVAQVEARGFKASDVQHVVVTHLDLDHAGGLPDFPQARVHLHAREHAAAMSRSSLRERERYLRKHWAHGPRWQVYQEDGDTWRGLPAVTKLRGLDTDIAILPMHGHTRGHSAIVVRNGARWLVHAGDAYFHPGAVDGTGRMPIGHQLFERATQMDKAQRRASVAALRELRQSYRDVDLFCAHDLSEFQAMQSRARVAA